jgi:hypothetical protein
LVYEELRKLAVVRMANEKAGQTLQPTALVHEAWLKDGLTPRHVKEWGTDSPGGVHSVPTERSAGHCQLRGSPGARKGHAGKYGEWTPLRQRGGSGGNASPLPTMGRGGAVHGEGSRGRAHFYATLDSDFENLVKMSLK